MAVSNKESVMSTHTLLGGMYWLAGLVFGIHFLSIPESFDKTVALVATMLLGLLGGLHFIARQGISKGSTMGEKVSFWLGCFLLIWFPIGTFIGIGLIACLKTADETEA